jgi:hypothetical protein
MQVSLELILFRNFATMGKVDTLGIEPRAFRMRSGCDTTTPCALDDELAKRCFALFEEHDGTIPLRQCQRCGGVGAETKDPCCVALGQWSSSGQVEQWSSGAVEQWSSGPLKQWSSGRQSAALYPDLKIR